MYCIIDPLINVKLSLSHRVTTQLNLLPLTFLFLFSSNSHSIACVSVSVALQEMADNCKKASTGLIFFWIYLRWVFFTSPPLFRQFRRKQRCAVMRHRVVDRNACWQIAFGSWWILCALDTMLWQLWLHDNNLSALPKKKCWKKIVCKIRGDAKTRFAQVHRKKSRRKGSTVEHTHIGLEMHDILVNAHYITSSVSRECE